MNRTYAPLLFIILSPIHLFGFFRPPDLIDQTLGKITERRDIIRPLFEQIYSQHGKNYPQNMLGETDELKRFTPSYTLMDDEVIEYASGKINELLKALESDTGSSALVAEVKSVKNVLLDAWQKGDLQDPSVAAAQKKYQSALDDFDKNLNTKISDEKTKIATIDAKIDAKQKKQNEILGGGENTRFKYLNQDQRKEIKAGVKKQIDGLEQTKKPYQEKIDDYKKLLNASQTISAYLSDIETIVKGVPALDPVEKLKIVSVDGGISQFYLITKNEPIGLGNRSVKILCYQLMALEKEPTDQQFSQFHAQAQKAFKDALAQATAASLRNFVRNLKDISSIIMENIAMLYLYQKQTENISAQAPAKLALNNLSQHNQWFFTGLFAPLKQDPNFQEISQKFLIDFCTNLNLWTTNVNPWAVKALLNLGADPNTPLQRHATSDEERKKNPLTELLRNTMRLTISTSPSLKYAPEFREENALLMLQELLAKKADPTIAKKDNINGLSHFAEKLSSKNLVKFAKLFIQAMLMYEASVKTEGAATKATDDVKELLDYATKLCRSDSITTESRGVFNDNYPYGNSDINNKTILEVAAANGRIDLLNAIKESAITFFTKRTRVLVSSATAEKAAQAAEKAQQTGCEKMLNELAQELKKQEEKVPNEDSTNKELDDYLDAPVFIGH